MGVDWITCETCSENFPDSGPYNFCECGAYFCGSCQTEQESKYECNKDDELIECDDCSKNIVRDKDIINYLLNKLKTTKEQIVKDIEQQHKSLVG